MAWQTNEIPTRIVSFIMHYGLTNKRNSNKDLIICHAWWRDKQTKFQQGSYHLSCMMAWETNEIPTRILLCIMAWQTNRYNGPDVMLQFKDGWSLFADSIFYMSSETSGLQILKSSPNARWLKNSGWLPTELALVSTFVLFSVDEPICSPTIAFSSVSHFHQSNTRCRVHTEIYECYQKYDLLEWSLD